MEGFEQSEVANVSQEDAAPRRDRATCRFENLYQIVNAWEILRDRVEYYDVERVRLDVLKVMSGLLQ